MYLRFSTAGAMAVALAVLSGAQGLLAGPARAQTAARGIAGHEIRTSIWIGEIGHFHAHHYLWRFAAARNCYRTQPRRGRRIAGIHTEGGFPSRGPWRRSPAAEPAGAAHVTLVTVARRPRP